ncbi:N-acyl homoserine lactonase family protein [Pelagibacterium limicola]|uniref:N-acyl homoserine lactonase family protein n=1 Tax=Pelagibacterium limicola TaxID=2791022 RepID=UPI0018AFD55A|nr:N-acyl homoserine lactonase family protein [Pelagibacterium limicola]
MSNDIYEAYAIAYARHERGAAENFIGGDPHNGPMPLNYYVWVLRNSERTLVIDTGFDERGAGLRGRTITRPVREGLAALGVDPGAVTDVVITHMHYDHAGNDGLFPNACFHLQDSEMSFATGRCMCHPGMNHPYEIEDVVSMVRRVFAGRVRFYDGDSTLFPGIDLHHIGGHARGLQALSVNTRRGPVIIASDTAHHYAHLRERRVFPTVDSVADVHAGYDRLLSLAPDISHIIPGHDPLVADLYPAFSAGTTDWIVRLDADPQSLPAL